MDQTVRGLTDTYSTLADGRPYGMVVRLVTLDCTGGSSTRRLVSTCYDRLVPRERTRWLVWAKNISSKFSGNWLRNVGQIV